MSLLIVLLAVWPALAGERALQELIDLVRIPNVASDRVGIRRNAEHLRGMFARRGFEVELWETAGNPLVWAELRAPGSSRTVLFYAHYDGQPVDAARWTVTQPFDPVVRDGRLWGRSAADDKAPIVALLAAVDAGRPRVNVGVILDGEEEAGSPSLAPAVSRHRDRLKADVLLILDGPVHPSGRPTLSFGARGIVTLELTVFGPRRPLHSGHYGNWVPNPAFRLARRLASMKDDRGRVTVPGFYEGIPPLTGEERRILREVPDDEAALAGMLGIAETETVGDSLQESLQFPSLNLRGMSSAYIGPEARTIIPSQATASLDLRLVKETPGGVLVDKVAAHIRAQGWHLVDSEPDDEARRKYPKLARLQQSRGTEAFRTDMAHPECRRVIAALERPVLIRTMGGTVPVAVLARELGVPAIGVPTVNFDNNQHSDDENLRLDYFGKAIETLRRLLAAQGSSGG